MIFKPELYRAILRGEKTITRRPIRNGQPCRYKPGRTYAIQPGRGQPSNGNRIHIHDVDQAFLGDITYEDARREGFKTRAEFCDYWMRLHDRTWRTQTQDEAPGEAEILDRFDERHANTPVWVIRFEYTEPQDRFLADRHARANYTTNRHQALDSDAPVVDDATLDRFVKENHEKPKVAQLDVWRDSRSRLEAEIRHLEQADLGRDVSTTIRALRRQLDRLDQKIRRAA